MKKIVIAAALLLAGLAGRAQDSLEPTQLGKWTRPAKTSIGAVDAYVDYCAGMYQESMDIRTQLESIEKVDTFAAANQALGAEGENELSQKKAAYQAVIDRITKQQDAAAKLPEMVVAATNSLGSAGLKAIAGTKAMTSTKDVAVLIVKENASLLKVAQGKLAELAQ